LVEYASDKERYAIDVVALPTPDGSFRIPAGTVRMVSMRGLAVMLIKHVPVDTISLEMESEIKVGSGRMT
jgi:hypothetical protein